jgi:hypothetical protein
MFVLHRCDNRKCVYPGHLFLGTAKDNAQDMVAKGRMSDKSGNRKLLKKDVEEIRKVVLSSAPAYESISRKYSVTPRTIYAVIKRQTWQND